MTIPLNIRCKVPALLLTAAMSCTPTQAMNIFGPKDVAGIVIDSKTGNPMEGAFVLAVYNESGGTLFGHSSSWCVRTKGVWTGPDGRFTFPKGKPNNPHLYAIKEGYILNPHRDAPPSPKEAEIKLADFRYLYLDRKRKASTVWTR